MIILSSFLEMIVFDRDDLDRRDCLQIKPATGNAWNRIVVRPKNESPVRRNVDREVAGPLPSEFMAPGRRRRRHIVETGRHCQQL
jgi:hypothetical protein